MRARWIICVFLLGMTVAAFTGSLIGGYITLFGCAVLYAMRRLEGVVGQQRSVVEHAVFEAHLVTEAIVALRHELSPKSIRSPIFTGDTAPPPLQHEVSESFAEH
jgi:hypothetical protein